MSLHASESMSISYSSLKILEEHRKLSHTIEYNGLSTPTISEGYGDENTIDKIILQYVN
jgi:hypothetical protein